METISMKLPAGLHAKLTEIAAQTERSKSYILRKALQEYLEDQEDYLLAVRLIKETKGEELISLDEMKKKYGLEN